MGNKIKNRIEDYFKVVSPDYEKKLGELAFDLTVKKQLEAIPLDPIPSIPASLSLREPAELGWDLMDGRGSE